MKKLSIIIIGLFLSSGLSSSIYAESQQQSSYALSQYEKNIKNSRRVDIEYIRQQNQPDDHATLSSKLKRQVIDEVELPLLKAIMKHTRGNQSRAANCLGVNRATLRSKLKRHGLL